MTPELQVALVSGSVGGGVALVASWVGWWLNSRTELKRTRLQIDAQADQTRLQIDAQADQTRLQIDAQTILTRYPDLVRAASDFAAEMRRLDRWQSQFEDTHGYGYADDPGPDGEGVPRDQPTAELRLATLEFFADDELHAAAEAWLEAFYVVWYDPSPRGLPEGAPGPSELLLGAEKRYVAEVRRALKVVGQIRD